VPVRKFFPHSGNKWLHTMNGQDWYIVQTKPKQEQRAEQHLQEQGAEVYSPLFTSEVIRRGVRSSKTSPMFPGYIFFRSPGNSTLLSKIRSTRGVSHLLVFGNQPAMLADDIVQDIQRRAEEIPAGERFEKGHKVIITSGPFRLYEAIFAEYDGESRAVVLLSLLSQQQKLVMDLHDLTVA